jgi:integrase
MHAAALRDALRGWNNMNSLMADYIAEIRETRSPKTAGDYEERLARFSKYMHGRDFSRQLAVAFLLSLKEKEFGEASISLHQATMKSFFAWMKLNGHIAQNFFEVNAIPAYRSKMRPDSFVFTEHEYNCIKAACLKIQNPEHLFWHDAIVCAWNTGLRLHDIAYLERETVNLAERKITITPNKTKRYAKTLEIPVLPELHAMLEKNTFTPLLFPEMAKSYSESGNKALSMFFRRLLDSIGIKEKSFHSFRHRMTSALLNAGTPISIVSSVTGQSFATLQRYSHAKLDDKRRYMEMLA